MKQIHFFALREDLLAILELVESKGALKYAATGNYLKQELKDGIRVYSAGAELPNLGTAGGDSSTTCERFLTCEPGADITPEYFRIIRLKRTVTGGVRRSSSERTPGRDTHTLGASGVGFLR